MNQFKRDFDQEKAFGIIRKALVGIGSPNFDDGTGLEKKSGLTNIELEHDDFVKAFKDSISPEQMKSFASLEKTIL